jgi:hypothetical protein
LLLKKPADPGPDAADARKKRKPEQLLLAFTHRVTINN